MSELTCARKPDEQVRGVNIRRNTQYTVHAKAANAVLLIAHQLLETKNHTIRLIVLCRM